MKYLVAVFLLCFSFSRADLCQNKFVIQNCPDSTTLEPNLNAFVYNLTEQSTLLCPQTRTINSNDISSVPEWRMISSISGKFCTETNYSVHEMCVIENNSSILVINDNFYANISRGEITVTFVHNVTVSNILTVRFADFGIYPQITYTTATEGDAGISFAFDIYIEKGKLATSSVSLYHMKNDTNTTINIMISPPKFLSCENHYPGSCQCTKDEEIAHVYKVTIPNPTPANDGIYLLEVTVDSRTFSASITLSVTPLTITSTSTTITSSISIPSSQTASPSPSQSPSSSLPIVPSPSVQSTNPTSLLSVAYIGISIVVGVLLIVFVIIAIIMVLFICYRKYKTKNTPRDNNMEDGIPMKNGHHPVGNGLPTIPPRTNSVSSDRPLVSGSATSSNVSTPTTKAPSDYTGVYCDMKHKNIGKMWKDKHDEAIHIMETIEDIVVALPNHHCIEILVYAKITDDFSKELLSRGITSDRSKLKWWQFVDKDRTPENTIEINGFRVIQVEGDPNDFDTHQLGILKSEYPVLKQSTQVTRKQRKYNRGLEETDHPRDSPQTIHHSLPVQTSTPQAKQDGEVLGILKEAKDLLKEIAGNTKKGADLQKEQLDVNKEVRDLQQEGNEIASAQLAHHEATDVAVEEEKSPEDTVV